MTKIVAKIYTVDEGSDDPRAIEGGGVATEKFVMAVQNSAYLVDAYLRAYYNRYGEKLVVRIVK